MIEKVKIGEAVDQLEPCEYKHMVIADAVNGMQNINRHLSELFARATGQDCNEVFTAKPVSEGVTLNDVLDNTPGQLKDVESTAHDLIHKLEQVLF